MPRGQHGDDDDDDADDHDGGTLAAMQTLPCHMQVSQNIRCRDQQHLHHCNYQQAAALA